jgi:hypothetical protein
VTDCQLSGLPPTLDAFLNERLKLFKELPPDDWIAEVAEIYGTTPAIARHAVRQTFMSQTAHGDRVRGYAAVHDALRARGHRLKPHRDSRSRISIRTTCPAHSDARPSLVVTREDDGRASSIVLPGVARRRSSGPLA